MWLLSPVWKVLSTLGLSPVNATQALDIDGPVVSIAAGRLSHVEQVSRKMVRGQHSIPRLINAELYVSDDQTPNQIAKLLVQHGVKNISDELDFKRCCTEPFAHGGFSSVYRGELRNGQRVAIKRVEMRDNGACLKLVGELCKRAAHELYTWSKCDHPGVLKTLGFAIFEDSILLVSPWMKNGSLTGRFMRDNSCDRLQFCIDLAGIVEHLHAKGIVHGDIKADNIILSDSGDIQLVDFGSATLVNYLTLRFTRTSPQLTYSVRFVAPEILLEKSEAHTAKSDVYSLAMTILQILTGRPPYDGKSDVAVIVDVIKQSPPPEPMFDGIFQNQCPKINLWALLLRCWDHDPNIRPTATEVKQTLVAIKQESGLWSDQSGV